MKKRAPKKLLPFIPAIMAMFLFSTLRAQDIYPSAVIQIKKADPEMMKKLSVQTIGNHENGFMEEFRDKNGIIKNRVINKSLDNSVPATIETPAQKNPGICPPLVQAGFEGNPLTPFYHLPVGYYASECNIAISNAGKIVSISNSWIRYYDENGALLFSDGLQHFCSGLVDAHVVYDPKADRFVFIAGWGYADPDVFAGYGIVAAFSKTNNPTDGWNFYYLPESIFNDNREGDYPLLAISDNDIFITYNRYSKGDNLNRSAIVQADKRAGYAGATLNTQIFSVQSSIGTIVPAQGGSTTYGPNMFFVSALEESHPSNKYTVYEITNSLASGTAVLKKYDNISSNIYYTPTILSYQPEGIPLVDLFADIDNYLENAFYENGVLQFCQNTNVNGKAAICLGRITGIPNNILCTAKTISDPTLYFSYPAIAYAGNSSSDNKAIVGFEHTGITTYPGLSAVSVSNDFNISARITVKAGQDTINGLWGDYSGICRRYNHPGEVWFEGQYGNKIFPNINWVAKLNSHVNCEEQTIASNQIQMEKTNPCLKVFPNPLSNSTSILFTISQAENVSIKIFDANGKLIKVLADTKMKKGQYEFKWNSERVSAGTYFLYFDAGAYSDTKTLSVIK